MKKPSVRKPTRAPWDLPDWDEHPHKLSAIKSLKATNPLAWEAVLEICAPDRLSFVAGDNGRRDTDFAEGRRWVGLVLREIAAMKMPGPKVDNPNDPHAIPKGAPPSE